MTSRCLARRPKIVRAVASSRRLAVENMGGASGDQGSKWEQRHFRMNRSGAPSICFVLGRAGTGGSEARRARTIPSHLPPGSPPGAAGSCVFSHGTARANGSGGRCGEGDSLQLCGVWLPHRGEIANGTPLNDL